MNSPDLYIEENSFARVGADDNHQALGRLNQVRNMIDFELLKSIFSEIVKKSFTENFKPEESKIKELEDYLEKRFKEASIERLPFLTRANRSSDKKVPIKINKSRLSLYVKKYEIFKDLLHEMCHDMSHFFGKGIKAVNVFKPLDEALTEDLANYIFKEYLKRSGDRSVWKEDSMESVNKVKNIEDSNTYSRYRHQLDEYVKELSTESGIPEDIVYKAWVGHYVRGDFKDWILEFIDNTDSDITKMTFEKKSYMVEYYLKLFFNNFKSVFTDKKENTTTGSKINLL